MWVSPSNRGEAWAFIVVGPILTVGASWFLFAKLRFHEAPGLLHHFPGPYLFTISLDVSGLVLVALGLRGLRKHRPE